MWIIEVSLIVLTPQRCPPITSPFVWLSSSSLPFFFWWRCVGTIVLLMATPPRPPSTIFLGKTSTVPVDNGPFILGLKDPEILWIHTLPRLLSKFLPFNILHLSLYRSGFLESPPPFYLKDFIHSSPKGVQKYILRVFSCPMFTLQVLLSLPRFVRKS